MKRFCKENMSHKDAAKMIKILKIHPELCDKCEFKKCFLAIYLYGSTK